MYQITRILSIDLGEREFKKRQELRARRQVLETIAGTASTSGGLTPSQIDELEKIKKLLSSDTVIDPFYRVVAATQQKKSWEELEKNRENIHEYGLVGSQRQVAESELKADEQEILGICGVLQIDGYTDASVKGFVQRVSVAQGEYRENKALFDAAFGMLSRNYPVKLGSQIQAKLIDPSIVGCLTDEDDPEERRKNPADYNDPDPGDTVYALSMRNIAATVRRLAADGVTANDSWLSSRIQNVYDMQTGVVAGAPPSALEIILPDLDESTDIEIIRENLNAVQAIYFAYMLEEMRLPQVVERIVELFRGGLLPLGRGKAGDYLFNYYKKAGERITEGERRDLYMRCFGVPGGDPGNNEPNREFNELWLRFVSAVSSFGRQLSVDRLLRTNIPVAVSQEQVRKAARDLGASLSRSGYGIAYFAATELQQMILEYRDLLSDSEVRGSFGARDMWQVIDQVNSNYLGGARNTHRFRTQARSGAVIIRWIANNTQRLSNRYGEVISVNALTNPQLRGSDQPTVDPTDWDLVQACEQWLAVGGVQEASIEQYAQPTESPVITSRPIDMPQVARDVLDQAGISLPGM
ncbi:hypothetical protein [Luteimonas panaciterrae]|uniref:hypothetical protein n=1 Tax=Luteimonas panaciterrae TaxID=363885 RepID=UPI001CFBE998|nr:hypothetical protein [Luteimonas panaciterrae]